MTSPARWAAAIAFIFVVLAFAYGLANPPFEATDEIRHFRYVRYLALNHALPPVSIETSKKLQAHHPPLYYLLAAFLTAPIDSTAGVDYSPPINPFWGFRYYEPSTDNKNQYLHSSDDRWPFSSGVALSVYLARWLSTLFGLGAVLMAYRLGRLVFPNRPALAPGVMAFVAFNPTFLHSASAVNNDAVAAFFGAWAIAEAADIAQNGPSRGAAIRLGIALGLGVMAKVSAASLGLLAVAAYGVLLFRRLKQRLEIRDWRLGFWDFGSWAIVIGLVVLLSGWWFVRNYLYTGDPMGLSDYQSAWVGEADRARLIREAISGLPYAWTTLWARFDYGQIVLPDWVYGAWGVLTGLAIIGLIRNWRQLRSAAMLIVALALFLSLASWALLMVTIPATAHARHILPAYPAIGVVLVAGWAGLLPRKLLARQTDGVIVRPLIRWETWFALHPYSAAEASQQKPAIRQKKVTGRRALEGANATSFGIWDFGILGFGILEFIFSLYALLGYLAPAFAYPPILSSLPGEAKPVAANFEGAAEIVGYQISNDLPAPGDEVGITVYWKPLAQTATPLQVFVHFVDGDGIIMAQRDTYPGLGKAVTTHWQVGQIFADTYRVFISDIAYTPGPLTVRVGLWNAAEARPLIANDSDTMMLQQIDLRRPAGSPDVGNPVSINFANRLRMVGYSLDRRILQAGDELTLTTHWQVIGSVEADYWAYAHVVGADGRIWAIADSEMIPPTTRWNPDGLTTEARSIVLAPDTPPGQYTLEFGVTRVWESGQQRLPVLAPDGHELGDHVELARVRVEE